MSRRANFVIEDEKKLKYVAEELRAKNSLLAKEEKKLQDRLWSFEQEIVAMGKGHEQLLER